MSDFNKEINSIFSVLNKNSKLQPNKRKPLLGAMCALTVPDFLKKSIEERKAIVNATKIKWKILQDLKLKHHGKKILCDKTKASDDKPSSPTTKAENPPTSTAEEFSNTQVIERCNQVACQTDKNNTSETSLDEDKIFMESFYDDFIKFPKEKKIRIKEDIISMMNYYKLSYLTQPVICGDTNNNEKMDLNRNTNIKESLMNELNERSNDKYIEVNNDISNDLLTNESEVLDLSLKRTKTVLSMNEVNDNESMMDNESLSFCESEQRSTKSWSEKDYRIIKQNGVDESILTSNFEGKSIDSYELFIDDNSLNSYGDVKYSPVTILSDVKLKYVEDQFLPSNENINGYPVTELEESKQTKYFNIQEANTVDDYQTSESKIKLSKNQDYIPYKSTGAFHPVSDESSNNYKQLYSAKSPLDKDSRNYQEHNVCNETWLQNPPRLIQNGGSFNRSPCTDFLPLKKESPNRQPENANIRYNKICPYCNRYRIYGETVPQGSGCCQGASTGAILQDANYSTHANAPTYYEPGQQFRDEDVKPYQEFATAKASEENNRFPVKKRNRRAPSPKIMINNQGHVFYNFNPLLVDY